MKTQRASNFRSGFTLMELMVAMAITAIIVTVLVSVTSVAIDTWNRSRAELRASRQAKVMVDAMAADYQALVTRSGNTNEWLSVSSKQANGGSTNASRMVFFTAATDRYNGNIGVPNVDNGGDVSCVGYDLTWKDPMKSGSGGTFQTFVLSRYLVDPKPTFDTMLGKPEIGDLYATTYGKELDKPGSFMCENVFQYTVTFRLVITIPPVAAGGQATTQLVSKTISSTGGITKFSIKGTGIETTPVDDTVKAAKLTSVEISLTVLTDSGVDLLRKFPSKANDAAWLAKNSYHYSKQVQLTTM